METRDFTRPVCISQVTISSDLTRGPHSAECMRRAALTVPTRPNVY